MIANQSGAVEKKYKITVTKQGYESGYAQEEARAGEFVNTNIRASIYITTTSGLKVPFDETTYVGIPSMDRVSDSPYCFVMPAEDVIIS